MKSALPITRIKFTDIPVKTLVIKAVDNMEIYNKITTLKFENNTEVLLNPNYWLAGVDYEDKNANKSKEIHDDEQNSHKDDIKQDKRVDEEENFK